MSWSRSGPRVAPVLSLVLGLGACAHRPVAVPPTDAPPLLILATGLGAGAPRGAWAVGLSEGVRVRFPPLVRGHSANTLLWSARLPGEERWRLESAGSVPPGGGAAEAERGRDGLRAAVVRPPRAELDADGRSILGGPGVVELELDLGLPHQPARRGDVALLAAWGSRAATVAVGRAFRLETVGGRFPIDDLRGPLDVWTVGPSLAGGDADGAPGLGVAGGGWAAEPAPGPAPYRYARRSTRAGRVTTATAAALVVAPKAPEQAGVLAVLPPRDGPPPVLGVSSPAPDPRAHFPALSVALAAERARQPAPSTSAAERREALAARLELGLVQPGLRFSVEALGALRVEDFELPTPSGTRGWLRLAHWADDPLPRPAVLYLCGHFPDGVRNPDVQALLAEAVAAGYVAAAVDLAGLGTRLGAEVAHALGAYLTMAGRSALRPYLEEAAVGLATLRAHPRVDAGRVAVAGVSMGGTLALILGALAPELAAVIAVAGTPDYGAYVRPIGSDAEQHPRGFAALGGLEGLPALIAPRPLRLVFEPRDNEHGASSSRAVVAAAELAYAPHPGRFVVVEGRGRHDQSAATRADLLGALRAALPPTSAPVGGPAAEAAPPSMPPPPLVEAAPLGIARLADRAVAEARAVGLAPLAVRPFAGTATVVAGTADGGRLLVLPGDDRGGQGVRSTVWRRLAGRDAPVVLVVDEGGRPGAAFASALARCGVETWVAEPRSFGTAAAWHTTWHRQLLALASGSLERPLGLDAARDLATAFAAAEAAGRPPDLVWAAGPEAGALALLAAAGGGLGRAPLMLTEAPMPAAERLRRRLAPDAVTVVPGILDHGDLDVLAVGLADAGRLEVTSGGVGLGVTAPEAAGPAEARAAGVARVLARFGVEGCLRALEIEAPGP